MAAYFDRCPDQLDSKDFTGYFASLIDTRSWSLVVTFSDKWRDFFSAMWRFHTIRSE